MSLVKPDYVASNIAVTCALNSLANNAYVSSAVIDNTANLYKDAKVQFKWKNGSGTVGSSPIVTVFLAESSDGGTTYSDGLAAGSVVTPTNPPNLRTLYTLNTPTSATAYVSSPFYVAADLGLEMLPDKFFLVFLNGTGLTSDATAGNFSVFYEGLNLQIV